MHLCQWATRSQLLQNEGAAIQQAGSTHNITCVGVWPTARTLSVFELPEHVSPKFNTSGGSFILILLERMKLDLSIPQACQSV